MNCKLYPAILIASFFIFFACGQRNESKENQGEEVKAEPANWAERLGYPAGKKVIMLHADDAGMCEEANIATKKYLLDGHIQSAVAMPPCEYFEDMIEWAKEHPDIDVGLHLTHTSEWKTYRWASVLPVDEVPSLIDAEGKLWHEVPDVLQHATVGDVAKEVRAQIDKSIELGYKPDHIDTHMGTLYGHPDYAIAFLKIAMEYGIPANVIDFKDSMLVTHYRELGYAITDEVIEFSNSYTLPKVDFITYVESAKTYEEKVELFKTRIRSLKPGITEIIFHPSVETENLKSITGSWQQRVWEAEMFADPDLIQFFDNEGIIFTNWKEIMKRFEAKKL